MRRLSEETSRLLSQLHAQLQVSARRRSAPEILKTIQTIALRRELAAIPELVAGIFDNADFTAIAVTRAIHELIESARPEDLPEIDQSMRDLDWKLPDSWRRLFPKGLARLLRPGVSESSVAGLASFHRSGQVRQRAVELLARLHDGSETPFLLLRLNDWVANVREPAVASVMQRLQADEFRPFVRYLHLILRLDGCRRDDHSEIVDRVVARMATLEYETDLLRIINEGSLFLRRRLFKRLLAMEAANMARLVSIGLQAGDPVLRLWAAQRAAAVLENAALRTALSGMSTDRFAPVRREFLRATLSRFPDEAIDLLECALFDRSRSIREFARFYLHSLGRTDVSPIYRSALATDSTHAAAAITGLGETGGKDDAGLVLPFIRSDITKRRAAAIRALGSLSGDEHVDTLLVALTDDSPSVTRRALQALQDRTHLINAVFLQAIFSGCARSQIRLAALSLLEEKVPWDVMPTMIEAAADRDPRIAERGRAYLAGCINRVYTTPFDTQRQALYQALSRCGSRLDTTFVSSFLDWLSHLR